MTDHLFELVEQVEDERSFLEFVDALAADWQDERSKEESNPSSPWGPGANGWENNSVGAFLEAASAWAESSFNGLPLIEKSSNPWRCAAEILHAGKFYE